MAVAGHSSVLASKAGLRCRSTARAAGDGDGAGEAALDTVLISAAIHVYVSQTDRGEVVIGGGADVFTPMRNAAGCRCSRRTRRPRSSCFRASAVCA